MDKIIVIGGGGHAKVAISIMRKLNCYNIIGYVDNIDKGNILETAYLGTDDILAVLIKKQNVDKAVIGVGSMLDNSIRHTLCKKLRNLGYSFPRIISPDAAINEDVLIGEGTLLMDSVVINAGTRIGSFSILNTNSSVDHDCIIGDFVHIAPGATLCGGVKIGNNAFVGAGATIIQYKSIGENCIIGAGAVVVKDCLESGKYVGIPARLMK